MFSGCASVRPTVSHSVLRPGVRCRLTFILRDYSSYIVSLSGGIESNLVQVFVTLVGIAEEVFKIMGFKVSQKRSPSELYRLPIDGSWSETILFAF